MPTFICECQSDSCQVCEISHPNAPKALLCPNSNAVIYRAEMMRGDGGDDGAFSLSNRYGISWHPSTRPGLVQRQTDGNGRLICGICAQPIPVDANGKIQYVSGSSTLHVEYPPIDHYNPDWRDRKSAVEKTSAYVNGDVQKKQTLLYQAFHADPLRITCKSCNLKRPK